MVKWQENKKLREEAIGEKRDRIETGPGANSSGTWWDSLRWNIHDVCLSQSQHGYLCYWDDWAWSQLQSDSIKAR